jgi:hypothetical protein
LIRFINEYWALLGSWSRWAEEEVSTWKEPTEAKSARKLQSKLQSVIATISPIVSGEG